MKKILAVSIAVLLIFGLAGCDSSGGSSTANPQPSDSQSQNESVETPSTQNNTETDAWPEFKEKIYVGVAIRSLSNPYHVAVKEGAELLAKDMKADGYDVEVNVLLCEGSDDQQISDIKALIARGGKNTVIFADPNNAPNSAVIGDICDEAGVYWTSIWNLADNTYPMDYNNWVSHNSPSNEQSGYDIAVALFESFETPGEGKILALEGMLANTSTVERVAGLEKALKEYPKIELLDKQPADWDMTLALNTTETWLSKYDDVDGIWAADDTMALGAVTALQNAGKNGKIGVAGVAGTPEAVEAIKAGDMTVTWDVNGKLQGYYNCAWAIAAKLGVIDVASLPVSDRMFYTAGSVVTTENADALSKTPDFDYKDFKSFNIGAMPNNWTK